MPFQVLLVVEINKIVNFADKYRILQLDNNEVR